MIRPLIFTSIFNRAARRVARRNPVVAAAIAETLGRLEADAFDPRLQTHKLSGELANQWACSVGYDLRIVFQFVKADRGEAILLINCGTHDVY